jgi:hypothetical protein
MRFQKFLNRPQYSRPIRFLIFDRSGFRFDANPAYASVRSAILTATNAEIEAIGTGGMHRSNLLKAKIVMSMYDVPVTIFVMSI